MGLAVALPERRRWKRLALLAAAVRACELMQHPAYEWWNACELTNLVTLSTHGQHCCWMAQTLVQQGRRVCRHQADKGQPAIRCARAHTVYWPRQQGGGAVRVETTRGKTVARVELGGSAGRMGYKACIDRRERWRRHNAACLAACKTCSHTTSTRCSVTREQAQC